MPKRSLGGVPEAFENARIRGFFSPFVCSGTALYNNHLKSCYFNKTISQSEFKTEFKRVHRELLQSKKFFESSGHGEDRLFKSLCPEFAQTLCFLYAKFLLSAALIKPYRGLLPAAQPSTKEEKQVFLDRYRILESF
jgi:hypothetical protein